MQVITARFLPQKNFWLGQYYRSNLQGALRAERILLRISGAIRGPLSNGSWPAVDILQHRTLEDAGLSLAPPLSSDTMAPSCAGQPEFISLHPTKFNLKLNDSVLTERFLEEIARCRKRLDIAKTRARGRRQAQADILAAHRTPGPQTLFEAGVE